MEKELIKKCFTAIWTELFGEEYIRDLLANPNGPDNEIAEDELDTGIVLNEFEKLFYIFTSPSVTLHKSRSIPPQFVNRRNEWVNFNGQLKDCFWAYLRFNHPILPGSIGLRRGWKVVKMQNEVEFNVQPMGAMPEGLKAALKKALTSTSQCDDPECKVCHPEEGGKKGGSLN